MENRKSHSFYREENGELEKEKKKEEQEKLIKKNKGKSNLEEEGEEEKKKKNKQEKKYIILTSKDFAALSTLFCKLFIVGLQWYCVAQLKQ